MYLLIARVVTDDKLIVSNEKQAYLISDSGEGTLMIEAKSKTELMSWVAYIEYHIKYANDRIQKDIHRQIEDIKSESRITKEDSESVKISGMNALNRISRISVRNSTKPVISGALQSGKYSSIGKHASMPRSPLNQDLLPIGSNNRYSSAFGSSGGGHEAPVVNMNLSVALDPIPAAEEDECDAVSLLVDSTSNNTGQDAEIIPVPTQSYINLLRENENLTVQLSIVRKQLLDNGLMPLEFIPLEDINKEIAEILRRLNNEEAYDQDRFDYLLKCLEVNPEYIAEKELERRQLEEKLVPFLRESLQTMRGFIPPNMQEMKLDELVATHGYSKALAKRIFDKKCLWLTRVDPVSVSKMHISDLSGKFNPLAQNLDVVELAAVYAALPEKFQAEDKVKFKINIFEQLKKMHAEWESKKLPKIKCRNTVYKDQVPKFDHCNALYSY